MILQSRRALAAAAALSLLLVSALSETAEADGGVKRDLRGARAAVEVGRYAEALEAYEGVLASALTDKQRFEALYQAVLLDLSAEPDGSRVGVVEGRLAELETLVESGETGNRLEIRALIALLGATDSLRTEIAALERESAAELTEMERLCEERLGVAAETLAAERGSVDAEKRERLVVEQRLELARRHLATREEELRARLEELSACAAETRFILEQLEGTQASEVQMLEVVMKKNEDLAKARLALGRREKELADQTAELERKEDEIRKREEAIREVTERLLGKEMGKDPPDS